MGCAVSAHGQSVITGATLSTTDAADSIHQGYTFQNKQVALESFTTAGASYTVGQMADSVIVRRGLVGSNYSHVWYQTTSDNGDHVGTYATNIGDALLNNNVAMGVHNLFANTSSSSANIERVDFMKSGGFTATEAFAIPVFDFGVGTTHESFKIALITSVDGMGNASGYSSLAGTAPFTATNIYTHNDFNIHRYSNGNDTNGDDATPSYSTYIAPASNVQGPGGLVFTLDDFAVSSGTTIYGYSLFGYDVSTGGDTANLIDWTNATYFPTNTPAGEGTAGGFDFAAVNGVFFDDIAFSVVPEPSTYALGGLILIGIGIIIRRRQLRA